MEIVISNEGLVQVGNATSIGKLHECIAGKKPNPRTEEDWVRILKQEHSTLEYMQIYIFDTNVRRDVTMHLVRHSKSHPRFTVQSGRPDWTGQSRPPLENPCEFMAMWNPISLIAASRQRLCVGTAFGPTRAWFLDVKAKLYSMNTPFTNAMASCMLPDCEYRGNKCYMGKKTCGRFSEEM